MKIVCVCDLAIPKEKMEILEPLGEAYGAEIVYFDDEKMQTSQAITEGMIKFEQEGVDAIEASPELLSLVKDADIIVSHTSAINSEVIKAAPNLKYVGILRSGIENVKEELCKERGIRIFNAPGRAAHAVADFTVGMMLAENRNIARGHKGLMEGKWPKDYVNTYYIHDLRNATVGIIGAGMIGRQVIERLQGGFKSHVIVHDPFMKDDDIRGLGLTPVSLDQLLAESDYISLHLRLSDRTHHLIGRRELALMKDTAYFINSARAGLVDEMALIEALEKKAIGGAALDVFENEPLPADSPLLRLENVTLTPHLAGTSMDTFSFSVELMLEQLDKIFQEIK